MINLGGLTAYEGFYVDCHEIAYFSEKGIEGIYFFRADEGGYWAKVDGLAGCYSQGETVEEVFRNIQDAIECHWEGS